MPQGNSERLKVHRSMKSSGKGSAAKVRSVRTPGPLSENAVPEKLSS